MMTLYVILLFVLLSQTVAQDSVFVRVTANGTSEDVKVVERAVADAVLTIEDACKRGADVALGAQTAARQVVQAAARATAAGLVQIRTTGGGRATGATSVTALSKATAIAEAIAGAIASVKGGPSIVAATTAIKEVSETAVAEVSQLVEVAGDASALAVALSSAQVFVAAVADALVTATAQCNNGVGSIVANADAVAQEIPAPADVKNTFVNGAILASNGGFANIRQNEAFARVFGNTLPALSPGASPSPALSPQAAPLPTPPGATVAAAGVFGDLQSALGGLIISLRPAQP